VHLIFFAKIYDLRIYTSQFKLHVRSLQEFLMVMYSYFTILSVFLIMGTFGKEYAHPNSANPCISEKSKILPDFQIEDPIFKGLIAQVWENTKYKLSKEEKFRGQVIKDPYKVELRTPINDSYNGIGYKAHLQVYDIKVYGASNVNLEHLDVKRSENLKNMHIKLVFGFESIEIKGTYVLHGKVGWWDVDSKGEQDFSVKIKGTTLSIENDVNYVFFRCLEEMTSKCQQEDNMTHIEEDVLVENIKIALKYEDIFFNFQNLGAFANAAINMIGTYILQIQQADLVEQIRKVIQEDSKNLKC